MKFLWLLMIFFVPSAWPQTVSGTSVIVGLNKNEIVVVADSRSTNSTTKTPLDDDCKISTFSTSFFIASSGVRILLQGKRVVADSQQVARKAYEASGTKSVSVIAEQWGSAWTGILNRVPPNERNKMSEGTDILFVGLGEGGKIEATVERVLLDGAFKSSAIPMPYGISGFAHGQEIVTEFKLGQTPRAKRDIARWQATVENRSPDDLYGDWVVQLMRWVILYDPSSEVGGQPEAVELRNLGSVQWLQPCPENYK